MAEKTEYAATKTKVRCPLISCIFLSLIEAFFFHDIFIFLIDNFGRFIAFIENFFRSSKLHSALQHLTLLKENL